MSPFWLGRRGRRVARRRRGRAVSPDVPRRLPPQQVPPPRQQAEQQAAPRSWSDRWAG